MRVAFLVSNAEWNGSVRAFAAAARAFAEAGDAVMIIVPMDSHVQERIAGASYTIVPLEMEGWLGARAWRIGRFLRRHGSEVVFVQTEREHLAAALAARLGARCAVVRRTPSGHRLSPGWRTRWAARLASTAFMFATEQQARAALLPPRLGPSVAATLGVRPPAPNPGENGGSEGPDRDPYHILCMYDGIARGRTALPIRTVALLAHRHPDIRLTIVGPGSDAEEIRMHVAAVDMLQRIDLLGERDDVAQLGRGATFGWVACQSDNAAFAMLDFMVAGLPVIAQYDQVSRHYVADGITGLLVPAEDAALAAGLLAGVLGDVEKARTMAEAGRSRVVRAFGELQMLEGFDQAARTARAFQRRAR